MSLQSGVVVIESREEALVFEIPAPQERDWALVLGGQRKHLEKKIFQHLVQTLGFTCTNSYCN